ncbi:MAG: dihydroorotase, partial [Pseudomonadota bacterium]|nr:dihydroorotase [Pseudomonadota bacterium]
MTATLIKNARLIDPSADNVTEGGVLIGDGRITAVLSLSEAEDAINRVPQENVIDAGGACLAPGIVDLGVKVCEPGERHKESFKTAGQAAAAGGVTTMVTRPDTDPAIDNPE